jgi:hypothetical protein
MKIINLYHLKLYKQCYNSMSIDRFHTVSYNDKYLYRFNIQYNTLSKITKKIYKNYRNTGMNIDYLCKNFKYIYENY